MGQGFGAYVLVELRKHGSVRALFSASVSYASVLVAQVASQIKSALHHAHLFISINRAGGPALLGVPAVLCAYSERAVQQCFHLAALPLGWQ